MSNILTFRSCDHALEWVDDRSELMELDASATEAAAGEVSEFRATTTQRLDDAIEALEQAHAKLLNAMHMLEEHSLKTRLQSDLGSLERLLKLARFNLTWFWRQRV